MSQRALVIEPSGPVAQALCKYLEGAAFTVVSVRSVEEAERAMAAEPFHVLLVAAVGLDGEGFCRDLKARSPDLPVALLYPPEAEDADFRAVRASADAYLVAPLKRGTVVSCARTLLRISGLLETVGRLEGDLRRNVSAPPSGEEVLSASGGEFEFFKRFLLMEVKRSRRYRYPVSFLLVGLDHYAERTAALSPADRRGLLTDALAVLTRSVRDIDVAVPFSEGRFLIFLPHTPRKGAQVVAARIRERLAEIASPQGVTGSLGLAAYEPGPAVPQVSFGSLMKEATEALRRAQLAGGDRVELDEQIKRDRISMG